MSEPTRMSDARLAEIRTNLESSERKGNKYYVGYDIRDIAELIAEVQQLRQELAGERGVLFAAVVRLGGMVEGRPTERVNFLQRIEELRRIEARLAIYEPPEPREAEHMRVLRLAHHCIKAWESGNGPSFTTGHTLDQIERYLAAQKLLEGKS